MHPASVRHLRRGIPPVPALPAGGQRRLPTGAFTGAETADGLIERLEGGIRRLEAAGLSRAAILRRSIITPSCGLGSLDPERAEAILKLTLEISERLRSTL